MKKLWEAFSKELGASFSSQYGSSEGETFFYWEKELSKFSQAEIQKGFVKFKNTDSTFLNIKLFRALCEPDHIDLGLPSMEAAFRAVIMAEWHKMPEAFRVLFAHHRYDLRIRSDAEARKLFKPIYDDAIKRISKGEKIKLSERIAIESYSGTTHTKRHKQPSGNEAMANIKNMMGMSK